MNAPLSRPQRRALERIVTPHRLQQLLRNEEYNSNGVSYQALATKSCDILFGNLSGYGNSPSQEHREVLMRLCMAYTRIVQHREEMQGRWALGLDTGMGKTESVVAFITALDRLQYDHVSVLICQSKIESLCELKRKLIGQGVPEEKIGLVHSYAYAPAFVDQNHRPTKESHASLPALPPGTDYSQYQFLLVTHEKTKGASFVDRFHQYRGSPRDLIIWDEALIASKVEYVETIEVEKAVGSLAVDARVSPLLLPVLDHLTDCLALVTQEHHRQKEGHAPGLVVLPELEPEKVSHYRNLIDRFIGRKHSYKGILFQFLEMVTSGQPVRVLVSRENGLIQYEVNVPRELSPMVVLDASFNIHRLEQLDKSIQHLLPQGALKGIKRYDHVQVFQMFANSGKYTIAKNVSWLAKEIAEVVRGIPADESVILFTFKSQGEKDEMRHFKDALQRAGVDLEGTISVTRMDGTCEQKPRVVLLTWGQETAINDYAYCQNVILGGVLHRSWLDLSASIIGQQDDYQASVGGDLLKSVMQSQLAHCVFQALGRGHCRYVNDGYARPMKAWLIHPDQELRKVLDEVMVGADWGVWTPIDQETVRQAKTQQIALNIRSYLLELPPDILSVSSRQLKKETGLDTIPNQTFIVAREIALEGLPGWYSEGRSIKRMSEVFSA